MNWIGRLVRSCSTVYPSSVSALQQYLQTCSLDLTTPALLALKRTSPGANLVPLEAVLKLRLNRMSFQHILSLKEVFTHIKSRDFGETLENRAIWFLPHLTLDEIVLLLRSFSGKTPQFSRLLRAIRSILEEKGDSLPISTKISVLLSFHLSKFEVSHLLQHWSPFISSHLTQLSWSEISSILLVYGHVSTSYASLMRNIVNFALRNIPIMPTSDLAQICTAQTHISSEFSLKLILTLEEEILIRAEKDEFSAYQLTAFCRGMTNRLRKIGPVLETQIVGKIQGFSGVDLASVMYHFGANKLGKVTTWTDLTEKMKTKAAHIGARELSWAVYGAFSRGIANEDFYRTLGDELLKRNLTIKDVEKVTPVYASLRRSDVLVKCRERLLQAYPSLPPMRTLTLLNSLKEAGMMTPPLYQVMYGLKTGAT